MNAEDTRRYADIIDLPRPAARAPMPVADRAAQFAPFAALSGYDDAIRETARLTSRRVEPGEQALLELNAKLCVAREHLRESPQLTVTYFQPDERKAGGRYETCTGTLVKIQEYERRLILGNGAVIPMDEILQLEGPLFDGMEF